MAPAARSGDRWQIHRLPAPPAGSYSGPVPRDLSALPKAHLHLHFTGSMHPQTLNELAEKVGMRLPHSLLGHTAGLDPLRLPANQRGWFRFQRLYDSARAVVRSEEAMRRIVAEAAQTDAEEGSGRLELQVDPTSYAPFVGGLTPALEIVLDEARRSSARTGVDIGVIVAASRTRHPLDARTLARLAGKYASDSPGGVVGFGLSNDERRGDTREFGPAFAIAARAGLALVPHGGELLGPDHIHEVLTHLRPTRLGHGVRTAEDPGVLAEVVDRGVGLELCPGSNVSLGVYSGPDGVPLRTLTEAGAQVALGADDPLLFGSRLNDQYRIAREVHGFTDTELAELARSSIRISLAAPAVKQRLLLGVDDWLAAPDPAAEQASNRSG